MIVSKKKFEEFINILIKNIEVASSLKNDELKLIEERKGNPLVCMRHLGRTYAAKASQLFLEKKDIESFRKYMYIYSKLNILGSDRRGVFCRDRQDFFGMLMSNNQEILNFSLKNIDIIAYEGEKFKYKKSYADRFLARTILLALKGEWEEVIKRADIYLENPSKASCNKYTYLEFEFLKALALKDIEKMKEAINSMLEKKVARKMVYNMETYFDFYLQMYVLMYAKIALYHGIDLEIDDEIAPKELIDNTPAKEYPEPYEFMKEFDFKTITPKEWKEWIYKYHSDPEELERYEKEGYFV